MANRADRNWKGFSSEEIENFVLMCRESGDIMSSAYHRAVEEYERRWGMKPWEID